jgi:hypothetical protein
MDTMLEVFVKSILPDEVYLHFEVVSLIEASHGYEMWLEEYAELLPSAMYENPTVVLDGFCHPLELLHFSIKGKPLYLKLYRRRWKESCSNQHYSNHYDLHPEGVKTTHEFASFLKGEVGCTADQYVSYLLNTKS